MSRHLTCAAQRLTALLALLLVVHVAPCRGDDPVLPSGEELVDQLIAAAGGAERFAEISNAVVHASMELVGLGISGDLTVTMARPALSVSQFEAAGLGVIRSGTNGDVAWEVSDLQGPRLLEGGEKAFAIRSAAVDSQARWREYYTAAETVGTATVGDSSCYKVTMTPVEGNPETWYLDASSKLLIKQEMKLSSAMGEIPVEVVLEDYREVEGVKLPFLSVQTLLGQQMRTVIEDVSYNVELEPGVFDLPPEIVKLVDKEADQEPEEAPSAEEG